MGSPSYMGSLFAQLGGTAEAYEQYKRAEVIARERVRVKEGSDASRSNLAAILRSLGQTTQEVSRDMRVAQQLYEEALQVRQSILDHPFAGDGTAAVPDIVRYELSEDHTRVGATIYRLGDPARALQHFQRAFDLRRALRESLPTNSDVTETDRRRILGALPIDIARSRLSMGELSFRLRDPAKALETYHEVTETYDNSAAKSPGNTRLKHDAGRIHGNYGDIKLHTDGPAGALSHYERCRDVMKELNEYDANESGYKRDLGLAHYRLGNHSLRSNDPAAAAEHFRASLEIREALVALDKSNDRRQMELMLALAHCGDHARAAVIAEKYRGTESPDNELLIDVTRCFAQCSAAATSDAALRQDYADKAIAALSAAIAQRYRDSVFLEFEPDLDPLRERDDFKLLVDSARAAN